MATIKPLTPRPKIYDVQRCVQGRADTALETCYRHGGVDNSVIGTPKPRVQVHDMSMQKATNQFLARTPLVLPATTPMSPLAFHHHLHGPNGRRNNQRRPLIAVRALSKAAAIQIAERQAPWSLEDDEPTSGWRSFPATDLPKNPFAVTRSIDVQARVARQWMGPFWSTDFEMVLLCVAPYKLHLGASLASATAVPPLESSPTPADAVSSVYQMLPGDAAFVPRRQPVWVEPPTFGSLKDRASVLRRSDIQPVRLNPSDWDVAPAQAEKRAEKAAQHIPTVVWRWCYAPFPEVAGRTPVYNSAEYMGGLKNFYGGAQDQSAF